MLYNNISLYIMIQIHKILLSIGYVELFLGCLSLHRQFRKIYDPEQQTRKYTKTKQQILIMFFILALLSCKTYLTQCQPEGISLSECFYVDPSSQSFNNIGIAIFVNTTLFLGGLHQELYNGKIKKKLLKFYKPKFQWDLFNKLFISPICLQFLFRSILGREIDPKFDHTSTFTLFSTILYSACHLQNYPRFAEKFGETKARNAVLIQCGYNLLFGLYSSYIFVRRKSVVATMIVHGYANFMGYPHYMEIFRDNYEDQRIRETSMFYLAGVIGCLISCLFIL